MEILKTLDMGFLLPPGRSLKGESFRGNNRIGLGVHWRVDRIDNVDNIKQSFDISFSL
jgi:hypothetical protein